MVLKVNDLTEINGYLSKQVRACRLRLRMTLREMDAALALSGGTVSRIERGEKRLDCVTLVRLAEFMDLSVDAFFVGAPAVDVAYVPPPSGVEVADVEAIVKAYGAIENVDARREILSLMRSVADSASYRKPQPSDPLTA
ncbi:MAG: helix-turn-helix transcriptional regulator [Rhodospirillales bacterium]|nr:helix-turn-helix transcriptional regulator [Rhodospirillales bacterium]